MGWVIHSLIRGKIILTISGKGQGFPGIGPLPTLGPFMVSLRTVVTLVGMLFNANTL